MSLSLEEAQARLLALGTPVDEVILPLLETMGRWASAPVMALRSQPGLALSAMDGYAICFDDLPGPWSVIGESAAGSDAGLVIVAGETARIFTGAPMPLGADTVLIQEEAHRDGTMLALVGAGPSHVAKHVRHAGSDFQTNDLLVRDGDRITAARIGLAATGGYATLGVRRRVRVGIASTGDELVPVGMSATGTMLPASNGPMLAAMLSALPVDVVDLGILPDRLQTLTDAFANAAPELDVLVTIGGASVGDHDLVRPALEAAGATIDFWRVALRPGKPLMAGTIGRAIVLGLPGNPVSAFVTAMLFLMPLVAQLGGAREPLPRRWQMPTSIPIRTGGDRVEFLRASTIDGAVVPVDQQGSAAVAALAAADVLIVRPAGAARAETGDLVEIIAIG